MVGGAKRKNKKHMLKSNKQQKSNKKLENNTKEQ
jgi:hypothetical protein